MIRTATCCMPILLQKALEISEDLRNLILQPEVSHA